jgi:hypothetical protein
VIADSLPASAAEQHLTTRQGTLNQTRLQQSRTRLNHRSRTLSGGESATAPTGIGVNDLAWMMKLAAVQISQIGVVAISPDGSSWPAAIVGGSVQIWDSAGGEQRRRLAGGTSTVSPAATALTAAGAARVTKPSATGRRPATDSTGA